MKKLLILFLLVLCFALIFVACKDENKEATTDVASNESESVEDATENTNQGPTTDNVEANKNMLVATFSEYKTLDELIPTGGVEADINLDAIAKDLKTISMQGSAKLSAEDTWGKESMNYSFAIKDNTFYAQTEYEYPDEKFVSGKKAKLFDSLDLFFVGWTEDSYDGFQLDVEGSGAINIDLAYEMYMNQLEEYLSDSTDDLPINFADVKLPTITAEDITYKDGKYIINKSFICESIVFTIDAMIDSAMNSDEYTGSADEYDDMKAQIKEFFNSTEFEVYYLVELESINGFGMSVYAKAEDIEKTFDISSDELGIDYIKASYEASNKGTKLYIEYKDNTSEYVNKFDINMEYISEEENVICGFNLSYSLDMKEISLANGDEYYYEYYREKITTIKTQSASITLDFSKLGAENASVLKLKSESYSDMSSEVRYKEYGSSGFESYSMRHINSDKTSLDVISETENKLGIEKTSMTNYKIYNDGETTPSTYDDTSKIVGTVNYTTENVQIPTVNEKVDEYMDYIINDAIVWWD